MREPEYAGYDRGAEAPVLRCTECGGEIYRGEWYCAVGERVICCGCIRAMVRLAGEEE